MRPSMAAGRRSNTPGCARPCAPARRARRWVTAAQRNGSLFLETYLDVPVEEALRQRLGVPVKRDQVVEIGCLAANCPTAMIELWTQVAAELHAQAEIATAVLSAPLRSMLGRIGIKAVFTGAGQCASGLGTQPCNGASITGQTPSCVLPTSAMRTIAWQPFTSGVAARCRAHEPTQ